MLTFSVCRTGYNLGELLSEAGAVVSTGGTLWLGLAEVPSCAERDDALNWSVPPPQQPRLMQGYGTRVVGQQASILGSQERKGGREGGREGKITFKETA